VRQSTCAMMHVSRRSELGRLISFSLRQHVNLWQLLRLTLRLLTMERYRRIVRVESWVTNAVSATRRHRPRSSQQTRSSSKEQVTSSAVQSAWRHSAPCTSVTSHVNGAMWWSPTSTWRNWWTAEVRLSSSAHWNVSRCSASTSRQTATSRCPVTSATSYVLQSTILQWAMLRSAISATTLA